MQTNEIHDYPGLTQLFAARCRCPRCNPPKYETLWNVFERGDMSITIKTWITGGMTLASLTD